MFDPSEQVITLFFLLSHERLWKENILFYQAVGQIRSTFTSHFHTANVTHFKIWEKKSFDYFSVYFWQKGNILLFFFSLNRHCKRAPFRFLQS